MKTITNPISKTALHVTSLAFLLAMMTVLGFAPQPARAGGELPFHANFITKVDTLVAGDFLRVRVTGQGQATYMAATTAFTNDQLVSLIDGSATATYTLTGNNGDTLILDMIFQSTNVAGGCHVCRNLHCYRRHWSV